MGKNQRSERSFMGKINALNFLLWEKINVLKVLLWEKNQRSERSFTGLHSLLLWVFTVFII